MLFRSVDEAEALGLTPQPCGESFKTIVYGGAPMYAADIRRALRTMGPRFVQIYGQGESPMVGTALSRAHLADAAHPRHAERVASVGVAQTPVRIRVAGPGGEPLPELVVGVEGGLAVRYALGGIKNVGERAMEVLVAERSAAGLFKSLDDLANRVDPSQINRRSLENLAASGAFDALEPNRAAVHGAARSAGQCRKEAERLQVWPAAVG